MVTVVVCPLSTDLYTASYFSFFALLRLFSSVLRVEDDTDLSRAAEAGPAASATRPTVATRATAIRVLIPAR